MIPEGLKDLRKFLGLRLKVILETGSSTGQGKVMRGGKKIVDGEEYKHNAAVCYMNGEDMKFLGVSSEVNIEVSSSVSSVVLKAQESGCPRGVVFVTKGPWINSIIESDTSQSGSPNFKGMDVTVSATNGKVKSVEEILKMYARG